MYAYSWDKASQETQDCTIKIYNRKSSHTFIDDQQKQLWHEQFTDFIFLKQLSTTQSSTVWLVRDLRDQKEYAAKIVQRIGKYDQERTHQEMEMEFLGNVRLDKCVKMQLLDNYQIQSSQEFYLIVMEYLHMGDLASYLTTFLTNNMQQTKQQRFVWARSQFIKIIASVRELHQHGYVHRDLKPQNFLVDNNNGLKLNDFGFVIRENTVDHLFCGTPEYMAPERLDHKKSKLPIARSSDMWSLGIILFELLTGRVPYQQFDREQVLQLIYSNFIQFDSDIDPIAKSLILQLLQINPTKRMTMEQLLAHPYIQFQ